MQQNEYHLEILKKIRKTFHVWVGTILIFCTFFTFISYKWITFFKITPFLQSSSLYVIFIVLLLFGVSFTLTGEENKNFSKQFQAQIFIAVCILGAVVFISGGLLDSPFSGAIAFFVGSFISMQRDDAVKSSLKLFNMLLVMFTIVILITPYILYSYLYDSNSVFIVWNEKEWIIYARIVITIFLLIITAHAASRINKELQELKQELSNKQD